LAWGKAQKVVERGGDSEIVDLSDVVIKRLALGLSLVCASTTNTAAVAKVIATGKVRSVYYF